MTMAGESQFEEMVLRLGGLLKPEDGASLDFQLPGALIDVPSHTTYGAFSGLGGADAELEGRASGNILRTKSREASD